MSNAANKAQIKKAENREKKVIEDLRQILETEYGRRFVWRYLERCGVFRGGAPGTSALLEYFSKGERNIGLQLLSEIEEAGPDYLIKMMIEAKGSVQ